MTISTRYRHTGLAMLRATTDPGDLEVPVHLDVADPAAIEHDGRAWLAKLWARSEVREALRMASPVLAARIDQLLDSGTGSGADPGMAGARELRRVIVSAVSYLLRWQRRATPFGLFAGVMPATVGPATAQIAGSHRVVVRADAEWLTMLIDQLERHPRLRPHLTVVADNTQIIRAGRVIVAARAPLGSRTPGPLREISVRHTRTVQAALAAAAAPIRIDALAARLAARFPAAPAEKLHAVVNALVDQGVLITSLRPPMTAPHGLTHLIGALRAAGAERLDDVSVLLDQLEDINERLARHNTSTDLDKAAAIRAQVAARMTALALGTGHVLAADVRLAGQVALPERVFAEAALAASVLLRLSTRPFGSAAWLDYHSRFRVRYGTGALVPVRDLVADSGLGYPAGYLGAPRARPAWRTLTERDAHLLALIQRAVLDGAEEIALTETDVEALTVGEHGEVVPPQRIELGVMLHAASVAAIDRGDFELWVTASPRAYTSMAGRFAPLLGDTDRARLAASYAAPTAADTRPAGKRGRRDGVVVVQLSFPPRRPHNDNVVRVPRLLPDVVSLSEHPDAGDVHGGVIGLDDLAVTADADQTYLVQRSTGRRVVPRIPHALDTVAQSPPLARFLAEVADARSAVFGPFDLGAARTLPYVPRIRYRRTVLAAARWLLTRTDLPASTGAPWHAALSEWRQRWRVPARVVLVQEDLRLPLNLDQPLDGALLHTRLQKTGRIELHEDSEPEALGWIGRAAELLIPMTATSPPSRRLPVTAAPAAVLRPGASEVMHAQLVGNPARFDEILTRHLPALAGRLADLIEYWWVRRHRDLIRLEADQHIAVFLRLATPAQYGPVAARLADFAADLENRGLPAQLTFAPYTHHPGRYGEGAALAAAEQVFATDTAAAITQITMASAAGIPAQALAAASMAHIAAAFAPDPESGYRMLIQCLPHQTGPVDRALWDQAMLLADPARDDHGICALSGGEAVAAAWRARHSALVTYHHTLGGRRDPAAVLRTLLHEHHGRALGVDPEYEKTTGRLARAAAMRRLALAGAL